MRSTLLCFVISFTFTNLLMSQDECTNISFYGKNIIYDFNKINPPRDTVEIISFWNSLKTYEKQTIDRFLHIKEQFNLNDWGFYMLVKNTMEQLIDNEQLAYIAICFYLNKTGYCAKIALSQNKSIILLLPSNDLIHSAKIVNDGKLDYYLIGNKHGDNISVLKMNYNIDGKLFNLEFNTPVKLSGVQVERQLKFRYKFHKYKFTISVDSNLIAFYNDYPQMKLDNYFNTPLSTTLKNSLYNKLGEVMKNMTEIDKAKFLLAFSQKAFKHKKDKKYYGESRSFFIEETMVYPFSDCEDRAILYAQLIKLFTNFPIIGVCYSGHVVTAIAINDYRPNFFRRNKFIDTPDERYYIADPTYKGLKIGFLRNKYAKQQPLIIKIDK